MDIPKDDRVTAGPTKENNVASVEASGEELWLAENVFEVVLLASVLGDGSAELEIDSRAGKGNQHAGNPDEQRQTDTAGKLQDGAGRGKDASADNPVDDQKDCRDDANLAFGFAGALQLTWTTYVC